MENHGKSLLVTYRNQLLSVIIIITAYTLIFLKAGTIYPYDYDSVNLALGTEKFNIALHQPHPPGYFFYVMTAKGLNILTGNPFRSYEFLNLIFLILLYVLVVFEGHLQSDKILLLFSAPLFLFLCAVPVIYGAPAFFGGFIFILINRLLQKRINPAFVVSIYAIAIGFRQDLSLFLLPIILYGFIKVNPPIRSYFYSFILFIIISLSWYLPTHFLSGNVPERAALNQFLQFGHLSSVFFGASLFENFRWFLRSLMFLLGGIGPGWWIFLFIIFKSIKKKDLLLLGIGAGPSLIFLLLIHGPKPGYYALSMGIFIAWAALFLQPFFSRRLTFLLICLNILFFIFMPPPRYIVADRYTDRTIFRNIGKQLLFMGASCYPEAVRMKGYMAVIEKTIKKSDKIVLDTLSPLGEREIQYMYSHRKRISENIGRR